MVPSLKQYKSLDGAEKRDLLWWGQRIVHSFPLLHFPWCAPYSVLSCTPIWSSFFSFLWLWNPAILTNVSLLNTYQRKRDILNLRNGSKLQALGVVRHHQWAGSRRILEPMAAKFKCLFSFCQRHQALLSATADLSCATRKSWSCTPSEYRYDKVGTVPWPVRSKIAKCVANLQCRMRPSSEWRRKSSKILLQNWPHQMQDSASFNGVRSISRYRGTEEEDFFCYLARTVRIRGYENTIIIR